jgi:hypothetical protein
MRPTEPVMSIRVRVRVNALVLVICAMSSFNLFAAAVVHPDPRVQQYLNENSTEISALSKRASNTGLAPGQRMAALKSLGLISEDAAIEVAAKLVKDASSEVAQGALSVLDASLVMTANGGAHASHDQETPWGKYTAAQHEVARTGIRTAASDKRADVRWAAVRSLVRQSDDTAVAMVRESESRHEITQTEAVNLCAQGQSDLFRACILDFLNEGSEEGQKAAIGKLGAIPSSRPMIRSKIFFNNNAAPALRIAAADVLGKFDPKFPQYAVSVMADPATPTDVWSGTMRAFADSADANNQLDAAQRQSILRAIENKRLATESSRTGDRQSLNQLYEVIKSRE